MVPTDPQRKVATNLQFVKNAMCAKHNKMNCNKTKCASQENYKRVWLFKHTRLGRLGLTSQHSLVEC